MFASLEKITADSSMRAFGRDAVYSPAGQEARAVRVILDQDLERTVAGMQGVTMEARTELAGYSKDLGPAKRGDVVTLDGDAWRLIQRDKDDGHLVTWIVTKERV